MSAPLDGSGLPSSAGAGPAAIDTGVVPDAAWWVALASLPAMGPARLRVLWDSLAGDEAWAFVSGGRALSLARLAQLLGSPERAARQASAWAVAARDVDVGATWQAHRSVGVHVLGDRDMPARLRDDVDPPVVLFSSGSLDVLEGPTVAIVGTRRCTRPGAEIAFAFGRDCARAGARVVSGLADGIDAAAHRGALSAGEGAAPPVAVVGSGLDVVYPPRSRGVWSDVARRGAVLSEYPLGIGPAKWRFPARNRIVAALADVVVVIESPTAGGSLYTVDQALARGRTVFAVPGSIRSAASAGSNKLLSEGATVACSVTDVLAAVGLVSPDAGGDSRTAVDPRPEPTGDGARVLTAIGWEPATLDDVARRTGLGLGPVAVAVARLDADGWIDQSAGRIERRVAP